MRRLRGIVFAVLAAAALAQGQTKLKPAKLNFFSKKQDVQLGKEAAAQVEKEVHVIRHPELSAYLERVGRRLASQPQADNYPYTFSLVHDKTVNAFALPGGPTFVHTGLILAAENEAELAGVLAHEIAHVALRHGTSQVSKANLIAIPAAVGAAAAGNDSLLGKLTQVGISLGANSALLKYSRNAERDADLLGAQIVNSAGYNPLAMAHFFEKLEAEGGSRGLQFFSDHPNPGNRVKAVEREILKLPRRTYDFDTGQFRRAQEQVRQLGEPPAPKKARQ